jgi:hypothetical protein
MRRWPLTFLGHHSNLGSRMRIRIVSHHATIGTQSVGSVLMLVENWTRTERSRLGVAGILNNHSVLAPATLLMDETYFIARKKQRYWVPLLIIETAYRWQVLASPTILFTQTLSGGLVKVGCPLRPILHHDDTSISGTTHGKDKAQGEKCFCWYNKKVPIKWPLCEEDVRANCWLVAALDYKIKCYFIPTVVLWNER